MMIEMYHVTTREFNTEMQKVIRNAVIPIVHFKVDLWTSRVSGLKFIG
ncbi:unnamed protein product [Laminaria digitata]